MSNSTLTPDEIKRKQVLEALAKINIDDRLEFLYSLTSDSLCECGRILEFEIEGELTDCPSCCGN
jgi:hypothetical protein